MGMYSEWLMYRESGVLRFSIYYEDSEVQRYLQNSLTISFDDSLETDSREDE